MVGGTQQQQLLHTQQLPTATESTTTPAEEEALKRNTDCVYFLASPLTCKKGSECEYRHSDIARVNPRDCWYWLNGNCLNPKCAFRHPPLDALMGIQVPTPVGPSLPQSQAVLTPAGHAQVPGKQGVPCIFFQKGFCLKGDRCPFFHAPYSGNKIVQTAQSAAATPVTEPPTLKKSFGGLEKCTQEQRVPQKNIPKHVEVLPREKPAVRVDPTSLRNGVAIDKYVPPPSGLNDEIPRYRATNVLPASHGNLINRPNRLHQDHVVHQDHLSDDNSILNGKDADEFSREPSPGFDVLVDDELGDSDYYHNEDQFGRTRDHEGRDLNPMNEYDIGRSADYNSMVDVDRDLYRDPRSYESYERLQGQFGWEDQRVSSERMSGGSANLERRRYARDESPDRIEGSDLRHVLAKQKRGNNGLRSVISRDRERDHARENHVEDRSYRGPRRDTHHLPPQESSLSSRLRGRIKIPGRSTSPANENDLRPEREIRNRGRLSPRRPQTSSSLQGRLRDRIKGRVQEDFNNEGKNVRGPRIGRDLINGNNNEFSGPKRLAELKVGKNAESYEQHVNDRPSLGKRKYPNQQSEGDLSFEGPKPLSEILKRKKRGSEAAGNNEDNINDNNQKEIMQSSIRTVGISEANPVVTNQEGSKSAPGDFGGAEQEKVKSIEGQSSSLQRNVSDLEEGMIGDEAMEDHHEPEGSDHKEGNSDGEDYNLDEGENAYPEEDYFDDDDADDFAKKMGVMYS